MGIDIHALAAARYIAQRRGLRDVLTIGRQDLSVPAAERVRYGIDTDVRYAEPLFAALGATATASLDASDYEDATYVADLNQPVDLGRRFDTVFDAGSLEHVFDQRAAFAAVRALTAPGGIACHLLPVNNLAGHGLWQYSTDLLHTVYSAANGWVWCTLFVASPLEPRWWYRVAAPVPGTRVSIATVEPVIAICFAERAAGADAPLTVQQPFYAAAWEAHDAVAGLSDAAPSPLRTHAAALRETAPGMYRTARNLRHIALLAAGRSPLGLSAANAGMERVRVADLTEA